MRSFFILMVLTCLAWINPVSVRADDLDPASKEALAKTQMLLVTPGERELAIRQNGTAQMVDSQVRKLAGTDANTEQVYKISSDIFTDLVKESGGDASKMEALVLKAQNDPDAFFQYLSERNKKSLEDISNKITDQSIPKK